MQSNSYESKKKRFLAVIFIKQQVATLASSEAKQGRHLRKVISMASVWGPKVNLAAKKSWRRRYDHCAAWLSASRSKQPEMRHFAATLDKDSSVLGRNLCSQEIIGRCARLGRGSMLPPVPGKSLNMEIFGRVENKRSLDSQERIVVFEAKKFSFS